MAYIPLALRPLSSYQRDEMDDIKKRLLKQETKEIPDPIAILGDGGIIIGADAPPLTGYLGTGQLQVSYAGSSNILVEREFNNFGGPIIELLKRRSGWNVVQSGDTLGLIGVSGADGINAAFGGYLTFEVDGTPGVDDMPTRFRIALSPDGTQLPVEALRINSLGYLGLLNIDPQVPLHINSTAQEIIKFSTNSFSIGLFGGANPLINFDANDYMVFDQSSSSLTTIIGGVQKVVVGPTDVYFVGAVSESTFGGPNVRVGVKSGTGRIILDDGTSTWEIDNNADTFRIYTPGLLRLSINNLGDMIFGTSNYRFGNAGGDPYISYDSGDYTIYDVSSNTLIYYINNVPKMSIDATKAAYAVRGVYSSVHYTGAIEINSGDSHNGQNYSQISFGYNGAAQYSHWIATRHNHAAGQANAIDFYTSDGTQFGIFPTAAIHGMSVSNGMVGIGEAYNPGFPLHIIANPEIIGSVFGQIYIEPLTDSNDAFITFRTTRGSDRTWAIGAGSGAPNENFRIIDFTAGAERFTITPAGRVFIYGGLVADVGQYISSIAPGTISVGNIAVDYNPNSGNWNTDGSTLILNASTYSVLAFHDSLARVDFIRAGNGTIVIGYDGGFGAANTQARGYFQVGDVGFLDRISFEVGTTGNGAVVGGVLYVDTTQTFFTPGSLTTVYSYTVPANTLSANGQSIWFEFWGRHDPSNAATKQLKVLFGGITVYDSTYGTVGTQAGVYIRGRLMRSATSYCVSTCGVWIDNISNKVRSTTGSSSSINWGSNQTLEIQYHGSGAGALYVGGLVVGYDGYTI